MSCKNIKIKELLKKKKYFLKNKLKLEMIYKFLLFKWFFGVEAEIYLWWEK